MSTRKVVLFETQYLPATETVMYGPVASGITATVDKFVARNADSVNHTVTVRVVPDGGTPTGTDFIIEQKTMLPGQTWLFPGLPGNVIVEGGTLTVECDAPGAVVGRASGREDSE